MILRVYIVDLILGWVTCLIAFIFMFFPSWKTIFKQSRQFLDTSSTPSYLLSFSTSSYHHLDSFLTARWIDRQSFWPLDSWWIDRASLLSFQLNWSLINPQQLHLSKPFMLDAYLDTFWHLYLSRFTKLLYIHLARFVSHFSQSLSWQIHLFTSLILFSLSKPSTHMIFKLSLLQITWYAFFSFHSSCISCV